MPSVGIEYVFAKCLCSCGFVVKMTEMSFIDDDGRMTDYVRPQVGCY